MTHPETRYHLPAQYLKPRNKYPVNFRTFPREGCFQPPTSTFAVPPVRDAAHGDIFEEELHIKDSSEEANSKEDIQMADLSEEIEVDEVAIVMKDEPAPPQKPCEGLTVVWPTCSNTLWRNKEDVWRKKRQNMHGYDFDLLKTREISAYWLFRDWENAIFWTLWSKLGDQYYVTNGLI